MLLAGLALLMAAKTADVRPMDITTQATQTEASHTGDKGTMMFLHGMESRYGDKSPEEVENEARPFSAANGYKLEVIPISGDNPAAQEAAARARIKKGGITAVYGFSAGGYTANRLQKDFPELNYTKIGAPGASGDIEFEKTEHMDQPKALADQSFEVVLNEQDRGYRNTGTIVLRDPDSGAELGTYQFATGGFGRGSAPFGIYDIGTFRDTGDDPLHIGPRWMLREPGHEDGEVYDPKLKDERTAIELHRLRVSTGTLGCIGVVATPEVWEQFMTNLRLILAKRGHVSFVLSGNPNASPSLASALPFGAIHNRRAYQRRRIARANRQSRHVLAHAGKGGPHRRHLASSPVRGHKHETAARRAGIASRG